MLTTKITRERLFAILDGFPKRHIAVVGDIIADEFLYGQIARVSREAPVLVLQYRDLVRLPGGAANAANNLLALGCRTTVVGQVGRDEAGDSLLKALSRKNADLRFLKKAQGCHTPVKTRILAGAHHSSPQQVVRVDRVAEPASNFRLPWERFLRYLKKLDGVILSDYGYGVADPVSMQRLAKAAKQRAIPLVVDSRFRMSQFKDATSITPNITELEAAAGLSIGSDTGLLQRTAREVVRRQRLSCLLVTQGRFGMTLFQRSGESLHIPIYGSDEVADVTGAGDTVIAVFTLALACGASPAEAASLANYAGGIVVMKRGTATVTLAELRAAVKKDPVQHKESRRPGARRKP